MKKLIILSIATSSLLFSANVDKLQIDQKNTVNESKINTNHESIYKSIFGLSNGNLVGISCNLYLSNDTEELKIKRPIIFHIGRTPSSRNDLKIIMEILLKNKVKLNNEWKNWYIENC